jgi:hypothetical protein
MAYDPEQITFFAKTDARGQNVPFGIKAKDRTRHVYVIGKTGMGKSTLLENMAVQDMQHGNGLAFIDPHGATAETLLQYVPEDRADDVLYFAPFDTQNPVAFNVMEDVGPDKRHLVAAGLMSVFKKIWVDAWSARMEYILQNTILALLEFPNSTLLGVNRMLSDKHYRNAVVENIKDPAVRSFWVDEFANYNERYMQEAGDAIKNKIGQFTANPLIRNIIGQPHTSFNIREMMDDRKILIANLSKGLIGEGNANLLGSMLTTRIYLAAMSRADLSPQDMKQMPNYYFYVDEFQSFANATFADILSEARKYHLNLTIAHQYIEQMEEEVRNAVFGNVGTVISFRVGPFDAEVLETIFAPQFFAVDIVNLGFAQIYLSLMIDGIGSRPFSATTLPPIEQPSVSCRDMVVARSRTRYGTERATVEESINAWMANTYAPKREERNGGNGSNGNRNGNNNNSHTSKGNHNGRAPSGKGGGAPRPPRETATAPARRADSAKPERDTPPPCREPSPPKPDLDALRSVLQSISTNDETNSPPKAQAKEDRPARQSDNAEREEMPAKKREAKKPNPPAASRKEGQREKPKRDPSERPKRDSDQGSSLKDALAAVLAEREAKSGASTPTATRASDPSTPTATPETAPSAQTPAKTPPPPTAAAPAATDPVPHQQEVTAPPAPTASTETERASSSHDSLDPKTIERMLKITGADNSPVKKR